jgi:glycosyltransferase involved in cell wall biosynthesis
MSIPRVSVLLPVRDGERYLREAVESILGQTFTDFELIALDDGSTDATPAILDELAARDERVVVERHSPAGLTAALNAAAARARAPYLARMDADDIALPDRFALQVAFLDAHPDVAVIGGAYDEIDDAGRVARTITYPTGHDAIARAMRRHNCILHSTVTMRADAFAEAGGYRLEHAEDYDLWLRIARRRKLANLSEVVLRYRRHVDQYSVDRLERQALGTLIARHAAGAELSGRVDRATAHSLGIDDATVDRAVRRDAISLAALLRASGDAGGAAALLRDSHVGVFGRALSALLARR